MKRLLASVILSIFLAACAGTPRAELNDSNPRLTAADAYLAEFVSPSLMRSKTGEAIKNVLLRLPEDVFAKVTDRRRPVMFVEFASSGTARFAQSTEVIMTEKDLPAYQEGMTLILISDALADGSPGAIEGIVAHELAHRFLEHIRSGHTSCGAEREANRLIKEWGFVEEYKNASAEFGQAKEGQGVAGCTEEKAETPPEAKPKEDDVVYCTADAKQCPDGSYVGRVGPDCQFEKCPGAGSGGGPEGK